MRTFAIVLLLVTSGCSSHHASGMDAAVAPDDLSVGDLAIADLATPGGDVDAFTRDLLEIDATPPPDLACNPVVFQGGVDPTAQGWTITSIQPATLSSPGAGITQIQTSTNSGAQSGGQLLVSRAIGIGAGHAFTIELVVRVNAVAAHNQLDSAAALLGSYGGGPGTPTDRAEMIYIDGDKIGWGDDTQSAAVSALDGQFHTYRLAVDATGNATVSRDGTPLLTRSGFTTNGTIAFGDQTNDANVDSTFQLESVSLLCA
jgi:hypothetical protein